jgi:uncharacterized protein YjbI with pentapeptide repeats
MPRLPTSIRTRQQQPDLQQLRLAPIGLAIAVLLVLAAGLAAALVLIALTWFNPRTVSEHLDVVKIALAVIAGIGGVVALVVAYRRQRLAEAAQRLDEQGQRLAEAAQRLAEAREAREQSKLYAERFGSASEMLGSDSAAVRLAGVHALANLADDWEEGRQTCIDVLCAYLRMPPGPEPDPEGGSERHTAWLAMREVRATVVRLIAAHLKRDSSRSWHGCHLDFAGVTFDAGADFSGAVVASGEISFSGAEFSGGTVLFLGARFFGGTVTFENARFSGGTVTFFRAQFSRGGVSLRNAEFSGGTVDFREAEFSGGTVTFENARFSGSAVDFHHAAFSGAIIDFRDAAFSGGMIHFVNAKFSDHGVNFIAQFSGSVIDFRDAAFSGGMVHFGTAQFSGGIVDFSKVSDWSHPPLGLPPSPHDVILYPKSVAAIPEQEDPATA